MSNDRCQHCERRPGTEVYGLCPRCAAFSGIRQLYVPRGHQTPEVLAKLLRLQERAKRREPLFQGEDVNYPLQRRREAS